MSRFQKGNKTTLDGVCRQFETGNCRIGNECQFKHERTGPTPKCRAGDGCIHGPPGMCPYRIEKRKAMKKRETPDQKQIKSKATSADSSCKWSPEPDTDPITDNTKKSRKNQSVGKVSKIRSKRRSKNRLLINNLPQHFTHENLYKLCSFFGDIVIHRFRHDLNDPRYQPTGVVTFAKSDIADKAMRDLNGKKIGENTLLVEYAKLPPPGYLCHRCKIGGHWIQDCQLTPPGYICHRCGRHGHYSRYCPRLRGNNVYGPNYNTNESNEEAVTATTRKEQNNSDEEVDSHSSTSEDDSDSESSEEDDPKWFCAVCDKTFTSRGGLRRHKRGKTHSKAMKRRHRELTHITVANYHCDLCNITVNDAEALKNHLNGRLHSKAVKEREGRPKKIHSKNDEHDADDTTSSANNDSEDEEDGDSMTSDDDSNSDSSAKDHPQWFCKFCDVNCSTPQSFVAHLKGRRHKNALRKPGASTKRNKFPRYHCDVCDVTVYDSNSFLMHWNGQRHRRNVEERDQKHDEEQDVADSDDEMDGASESKLSSAPFVEPDYKCKSEETACGGEMESKQADETTVGIDNDLPGPRTDNENESTGNDNQDSRLENSINSDVDGPSENLPIDNDDPQDMRSNKDVSAETTANRVHNAPPPLPPPHDDEPETTEKQTAETSPTISPAISVFYLNMMDSVQCSQKLITEWQQILNRYGVHFVDSPKSSIIGAKYKFDPTTKRITYKYQCPYPPRSQIAKSESFDNAVNEGSATMMATARMMVFMFEELFGLNFLDIQLKLVFVKQDQYHCQVIHDGENFVQLQFPPHQIKLIDESEHYSLQHIWDKMGDGIGQICKAIYDHFLIKGHETFNAVAMKQEIEDIQPTQEIEVESDAGSEVMSHITIEPVINFVGNITVEPVTNLDDVVEEDVDIETVHAVAGIPDIHDGAEQNGAARNRRRHEMEGSEHDGDMRPRKRIKVDPNRNVQSSPSEFIDIASESDAAIVKRERAKNWYDDWDHREIVRWIGEIEEGRFAKYVNKLSHTFAEEEIQGSDLTLITEQNWKEWGILNFRDRKILHKCVQHLTVRLS